MQTLTGKTDFKWIGCLVLSQAVLTGLIVGLYLALALLFSTVSTLIEPVLPYLDKLSHLEQQYKIPAYESTALLVVYYNHEERGFSYKKFTEKFLGDECDKERFEAIANKYLETNKLEDDFTLISIILQLSMNFVAVVEEEYIFPVLGQEYHFVDSWHAARTYGGNRQHLGTDIMCAQGTPLVAVTNGYIERIGWDRLGGWRVGLRGTDGNYYYYAHLLRYATGMAKGNQVRQGDLLGYAGSSGYGPQGTTGRFQPHLHFGIYQNGRAINPYPFLCLWEGNGREE